LVNQKAIVDSLISEIYKNVFYLNFSNNKLKYKSKTIASNLNAIINFLGLCYTSYKNGFETESDAYNYISGSHYFNIEYFKNKKLLRYYKNKAIKKSYDYKKYKRFILTKDDFIKIKEKYLIKEINDRYIISLVDYLNHNLQDKYSSIKFKEDTSIYAQSINSFFLKFGNN
jgi:hypothetical protein